jgi:hypothetical protein
VDSGLEPESIQLFSEAELALLKRQLLLKGRDLAGQLADLLAGKKPKGADLLKAKPGETPIEKVRRYLNLVDRKIKAIAAGTYGHCEGCDVALPYAHLAELPWMDRCAKCDAVG